MTLKTGVVADEIQCCVTEINSILKYIKILEIAIIYYNITVFSVFLIK